MDVTEITFAVDVVEASRRKPVIVDFWAPWCGPCRVLGPVLERVVAEYGDALSLVKVNTDDNQTLARAFDVRGIPAVMAFVDGRVVDAFTGAIGEPGVRSFVAGLVASPYEGVIASARALVEEGQLESARAALHEIPFADAAQPAADRLLAHIEILELAAEVPPQDRLLERSAALPAGEETEISLAIQALARGDITGGLERLLTVVGRHGPPAERARALAVLAFRTLEDPDELRAWQARLSLALY